MTALLPMRARLLLPAALLVSPFAARAQSAAEYPNKPVRWIVPSSTGAGTDAGARSFGRVASEQWKQNVVVDNRPGAAGMIALDGVAAAAPDGYTLGFFSVSQFVDATLLGKYVFDAQKDFTPISMLATTPLLLVTNATTKLDTLPQLVAAAKAKPGALNYASGGAGGITHLAMEVFLRRAGIKVAHIPYKGSGPALVDILAGNCQMGFLTPAAALPHVRSGRLRVLGVASPKRSPLVPDVPTFEELGLGGVLVSTWYGLFGPANMPSDLVNKIASTVAGGTRVPAVREKMVGEGLEPILSSPAEFASFLKTDREQWIELAKAINFKKEG